MHKILAITKKEFYEHLKSKRLVIFGVIFGAIIPLTMGLTAYYTKGVSPNDVLAGSHGLATFFYVILGIAMAYDVIVREKKEKSLYTLLSKPISREEVVIGKFLGSLLSICAIIIPVLIIGYLIAIAITHNTPSVADIGAVSSYLGIILLGIACYVGLAMAISSAVRSSTTAILSAIGAWFGLGMIYSIVSLALMPQMLTPQVYADPTLMQAKMEEINSLWYVKLAYAMNPGGCMDGAAYSVLGLKSLMGQGLRYPLSTNSMIISLVIFLAVAIGITLGVFRSKDLT